MAEPERIGPEEVNKKLKTGSVLLVCAYDDEEKFRMFHIEGALSFSQFKSQLPSLSKEQEIVFYCA